MLGASVEGRDGGTRLKSAPTGDAEPTADQELLVEHYSALEQSAASTTTAAWV
jgi:hypothetical protein